jgi:hypothetical protein
MDLCENYTAGEIYKRSIAVKSLSELNQLISIFLKSMETAKSNLKNEQA